MPNNEMAIRAKLSHHRATDSLPAMVHPNINQEMAAAALAATIVTNHASVLHRKAIKVPLVPWVRLVLED